MKKNLLGLVLALLVLGCQSNKQQAEVQEPVEVSAQTTPEMDKAFYDFSMPSIDGQPIDFSTFKGKKVLVVNTASECGYTPQYADLEALHKEHGDKVVVLGFPANNFGGQEPGSNEEIAEFCKKNFGVSFQLFEKISVTGKDQHPLYQWLKAQSGEEPKWNFSKYLIDENGKVVAFYPSKVNPMDPAITDKL
jgi:glutathione peroxidase